MKPRTELPGFFCVWRFLLVNGPFEAGHFKIRQLPAAYGPIRPALEFKIPVKAVTEHTAPEAIISQLVHKEVSRTA
jgi:hypothetical protein